MRSTPSPPAGGPVLVDKLSALYASPSSPSPPPTTPGASIRSKRSTCVKALVLDAVPAGTRQHATTADAVYVPREALKPLGGLQSGCWVDLSYDTCQQCSRAVRVQVVAVAGELSVASSSCKHTETEAAGGVVVGISPLTAHNLGLMQQLGPFSADASATSAAAAAAVVAPLFDLQLQPVDVYAQPPQQQQKQQQQQGSVVVVAPSHTAQSVVICKVGQPLVTPLAGLTGASINTNNNTGSSGSTPASAADGQQQQEGGVENTNNNSSSSRGESGGGGDSQQQSGDGDELLELLQTHFTQRTRFVSPGDLIGVLVPTQLHIPTPQQHKQQQQLQQYDVAYFQVQQVSGENSSSSNSKPLAINPASTHLVLQGGITRSLLPVGFKAFAASAAAAAGVAAEQPPCCSGSKETAAGTDKSSSSPAAAAAAADADATLLPLLGVHSSAAWASTAGLSGVPGPLTPTWRAVASILAPLLHPASASVELSVALLLYGPRGSGRRTAARAAAAAVGLNVIELSCLDLRASTDAKTVAALQAAAAEASRFAPTLLLLSHLPALLPGGPAAALGTAAGNAAILQITDVLSGLIRQYGSTSARQAVLPWGKSAGSRAGAGGGSGRATQQCQQDSSSSSTGSAVDDAVNSEVQQQQQEEGGVQQQQHQQQDKQQQQQPGFVFVVGVCESLEDLPAELAQCFSHHVEAHALQREHYAALLTAMLQPLQQHHHQQQLVQSNCNAASTSNGNSSSTPNGVAGSASIEQCLSTADIAAAASQMVGLLPSDVAGVLADAAAAAAAATSAAAAAAERGSSSSNTTTADSSGACQPSAAMQQQQQPPAMQQQQQQQEEESLPQLQCAHLEEALKRVKARTATEIGAPQVPNVTWGDVGGLEDVKQAILDTIELPLKHRHLFAAGLRRRSGVLLYGPPGSGKTLLAKAVATQCSSNFLSVKGPELINMYVGESERQVREAFARARRARPCVMFFDELDSLAPARGASGDSGGVMDRVVAQLLAEIDGVQGGGEDLFIIGATNRPDLLDPALLRPGRLDTLLYVGIAEEPDSKLKVLQALTRKFKLSLDVDLNSLAHSCPVTLSGADLYALCADAWMVAFKRHISLNSSSNTDDSSTQEQQQELGQQQREGDKAVAVELEVSQADFEAALRALTPSLSQEELGRYLAIKQHYDAQQGFGQQQKQSASAAGGAPAVAAAAAGGSDARAQPQQQQQQQLPAAGVQPAEQQPHGDGPAAPPEPPDSAAAADRTSSSSQSGLIAAIMQELGSSASAPAPAADGVREADTSQQAASTNMSGASSSSLEAAPSGGVDDGGSSNSSSRTAGGKGGALKKAPSSRRGERRGGAGGSNARRSPGGGSAGSGSGSRAGRGRS